MALNLAEFAKWAIRSGPWDGSDLDGGDIQDKAVECGILVETKYDPEKHGPSETDQEPGDPWYVFSDEFKSALASALGNEAKP
jgi:hypothetical protein